MPYTGTLILVPTATSLTPTGFALPVRYGLLYDHTFVVSVVLSVCASAVTLNVLFPFSSLTLQTNGPLPLKSEENFSVFGSLSSGSRTSVADGSGVGVGSVTSGSNTNFASAMYSFIAMPCTESTANPRYTVSVRLSSVIVAG